MSCTPSAADRPATKGAHLEHFPAKCAAVRRRKCDKCKNLERVSDSEGTETALASLPSTGSRDVLRHPDKTGNQGCVRQASIPNVSDRATIDLVDSPEAWSRLGHDYRVIVHVTIWNSEDVVTVPVGALFRQGEDWAVFAVKDGRARTTGVKIGHRNNRTAEVLSGLLEGDKIVLHPSDRVKDGVAIEQRDTHCTN
jgi:hypothetical protein